MTREKFLDQYNKGIEDIERRTLERSILIPYLENLLDTLRQQEEQDKKSLPNLKKRRDDLLPNT